MGKRNRKSIKAFIRCDASIDNYKKYQFGERIIGHLYHRNNHSSKIRPFIIFGQYFNKHDKLIGLDLFGQTSQSKNRIDEFKISQKSLDGINPKNDKDGFIVFNNTYSFDIQQLDTSTPSYQTIKSKLIPDLIARRVQNITFNSQMRNENTINFNQAIRREGFLFPTITPDMIASGIHMADIPRHPDMTHIEHVMPDYLGLTQDDVNFITVWACLYTKHCIDNHLKVTWPEPGTWPHWDPVDGGNGNMIPCISPARKKELLAEAEIFAPKVTVSTKPNAAQKRLAGLGNLNFK